MSIFQGCKLFYFNNVLNNPLVGRGEPVRLLLADAGIHFEYKRVDFPDWPSTKQSLIENNGRLPTMPYVTTASGQLLGRTAPLMRKISKDIGKYIPADAEAEYLADAYSDLYLDWRSKWIETAIFGANDEQVQKTYTEDYSPSQYTNWNNIIGDHGGPYVLGQEISYVDFMLYSIIRDDSGLKFDAKKYPNIATFVKAFESRPSLHEYFTKIA